MTLVWERLSRNLRWEPSPKIIHTFHDECLETDALSGLSWTRQIYNAQTYADNLSIARLFFGSCRTSYVIWTRGQILTMYRHAFLKYECRSCLWIYYTVQVSKMKLFHPTHYNGHCNLSMLGYKSIYVDRGSPDVRTCLDIQLVNMDLTEKCLNEMVIIYNCNINNLVKLWYDRHLCY